VVTGALQHLPFDLIQEWGFSRTPFQDLGKVNDEPILHAVADSTQSQLVGITTGHLFTVSFDDGKIEVVGEVPGFGRIANASKSSIVGQDGPNHLWALRCWFTLDSAPRRQATGRRLGQYRHHLGQGCPSGLLYTADNKGSLYSYDEQRGFSAPLGQATLAPVGPLAVTHDGRLFGFCGSEMAKMFCYDPQSGKVTNLGVAVSVLERRRYGIRLWRCCNWPGDGEIVFGEDDDLGHLWLYFPRIQARHA